jgi:hypothetical protein
MAVRVITGESANLPVGGVWEMTLLVTDSSGVWSDDQPVITVTGPGGELATPDAVHVSGGAYRAQFVTTAPGRHTARAVTSVSGSADLTAWVAAITPAAGMPTIEDLRGISPERDDPEDLGYLGKNSFTDDEIQDALDAEASAQRDVCFIPAAYPPSLRQALLRRVAVNLANRALPLAIVQGDAEMGGAGSSAYLPGKDPQVRRYERAYPRLVMG